MDLTILQKVNELVEQGRNGDEIRRELLTQGISSENINEALAETGVSTNPAQPSTAASVSPDVVHREKVIQPSPGFDPSAK